MSLAGLLEDDVTLLDHHQVDLTGAGEATYVVSADITYEYPAPIRSLRHQFVVVPRRRHGDQRRNRATRSPRSVSSSSTPT